MLVGYACSISREDKLSDQLDALGFAGCEKIYAEEGYEGERLELAAATSYLRSGDTLVVCRLDCMSGSLKHLVSALASLDQNGIKFHSLEDGIETSSAVGRSIAKTIVTLSAFDQIVRKQRRRVRSLPQSSAELSPATEEIAHPSRRKPGRQPVLSAGAIQSLWEARNKNRVTVPILAKQLGVSAVTIYRYLKAASGSDLP